MNKKLRSTPHIIYAQIGVYDKPTNIQQAICFAGKISGFPDAQIKLKPVFFLRK